MPKRSHDPIDNARRKLAEAQLELHLAQVRRTRAIAQGEREVREATERAARRELNVTKRVERRAGDVARAEARLYTLSEKVRRLRIDQAQSVDRHAPSSEGRGDPVDRT
jgi:hypothetical protein